MEYRLDSRKIRINEGSLKLIGQGAEGKTYRYKNKALKIKDSNIIGLSFNSAKYMTGIRTTNILLPKDIFYKNDRYAGYTTRYIYRNNNFRLIDLKKDELLDHVIFPIEEDIEVLSSKNILLNDLSSGDTISNNSLYILDPGSYIIMPDIPRVNIKFLNMMEFKKLLNSLVNIELKKNKIFSSNIVFNELKNTDSASSYYSTILSSNTSIKELVKRG